MDSYYLNKKCNSEVDGANFDCWSEFESGVSNMHMLFRNKTEDHLNEKLEFDCHLFDFENISTNSLLLICIIVLSIIIIPISIFFLLKKFKKNMFICDDNYHYHNNDKN